MKRCTVQYEYQALGRVVTPGEMAGDAASAALAAFAVWEEWLNLIAGLALMISPWVLGFQDNTAMSIDVAIGDDEAFFTVGK